MNLYKFVPAGVSRTVGRTLLKADKHSPQILFGVGVVGTLTATVLACRATLKVEDVLKDHEKKALDVKTVQHAQYTEADRKQDIFVLYTQTTVRLVRLYAPAVILGSVSIGCLTKSHNILTQRNAALSAAYAGLDATFKNYRDRVKESIGEEEELAIFNDVQSKAITNPDGSVSLTKSVGPNGGSPYAVFYDSNNRNFSPSSEANIMVLRQRQNYLNDMLRMRGHMFLNEVYRELGFDDTTAGAVVGWIFDPEGRTKRPDGSSHSSHIDFGIWADHNRDSLVDFVQYNEGIFLDFNVEGEIHKLLHQSKPIWQYRDQVIGKLGRMKGRQ